MPGVPLVWLLTLASTAAHLSAVRRDRRRRPRLSLRGIASWEPDVFAFLDELMAR